jgi:hypothetical protein
MDKQFTYLGANLTWDDYEMLALARISEPHRRIEPELFQSKWFDYRHLHPVSATYMYAAQYAAAVRECYIQTKDKNSVDEVKAFTPENVFECRELIGFWLARQGLDRLGVRYDFALRYAMTRFATRGWRFFPRPNQLHSEELLLDIRDAWRVECKHTLQLAKHPKYLADNYTAHPDQIGYLKWLCTQVESREHPHRAVSRLLTEQHITPVMVEAIFGELVLAKAVSLCAV